MKNLKESLELAEVEIATICRRQMQLGFRIAEFPEMDNLKVEIKPVTQLWDTIEQYDRMIESWKNNSLNSLSVELMEDYCNEWTRKLLYCKKNPLLNKFPGPMQFCDYILRQVDGLKKFLPLLLLLKGRGMQPTHINMINKQFGYTGPNAMSMKTTNFRWLSVQDLHLGHKLEYVK